MEDPSWHCTGNEIIVIFVNVLQNWENQHFAAVQYKEVNTCGKTCASVKKKVISSVARIGAIS